MQLELRGSIEPRCGFTQVPGPKDLGILHQGTTSELGTLAYRCNLANAASVTVTVQSEHGGLKREDGSEVVAYAASWDVQGNGSTYVEAATLTNPVNFTLNSGTATADEGGLYRVRVTGPTETLLAGSYRDRLIYTITP